MTRYGKDRSGKKPPLNFILLLCILCVLAYHKTTAQTTINNLNIKNVTDLRSFFTYTPDRIPLLCGHRGGATRGFPENCIATFENTLKKIPAFFELDPRLTKDSVVIVMHDATLDRTTNGKGKISDYTWKELQQLKLKDSEGNITPYSIPLLDDILRWAKGKTILMLDKKDVPLQTILQKITDHNAESFVLVSTYEPEEAAFYHKHNKNILFEAFILQEKRIKEYENAGVPWRNIVAYVSKSKDKNLYDALHERKVMCIYYTAPVLEKIKDSTERVNAYQHVIKGGGDILLSDRIFEVSDAIQSLMPEKSSKRHYFTKRTFEKYTAVDLPDSISSGKQGAFHVQGVAVDKARGFIYFSFTDKLIKMDLSGKLVGSVTGLVGHLGDMAFDPGTNTIYASLEYKNDAIGKGISKKLGLKNSDDVNFYIAMFDGSQIVRPDMNAGEGDLLKTVWLKEVVDDYNAGLREGDRIVSHRFGCSGIDGVALGPSFGDIKEHKMYLYVAYGIYGDTTRNDNDHQVILKYNLDNWNTIGQKLIQENPHHAGPEKPADKYFIKTGNTHYGIQNLAYDPYTGNFFVAVYKGSKSRFPNYSLFVIDGHKKPGSLTITSDNKKIKVRSLSLLNAGLRHAETEIRGWNFEWGSTGLFPLGDGLFYISHNKKTNDGQQTTTIHKYKWTGNADHAFMLAN